LSRKSDEIGDNHPKLGGFDSRYHIRRLELTNCHKKKWQCILYGNASLTIGSFARKRFSGDDVGQTLNEYSRDMGEY